MQITSSKYEYQPPSSSSLTISKSIPEIDTLPHRATLRKQPNRRRAGYTVPCTSGAARGPPLSSHTQARRLELKPVERKPDRRCSQDVLVWPVPLAGSALECKRLRLPIIPGQLYRRHARYKPTEV
jgi:hypothetical protein